MTTEEILKKMDEAEDKRIAEAEDDRIEGIIQKIIQEKDIEKIINNIDPEIKTNEIIDCILTKTLDKDIPIQNFLFDLLVNKKLKYYKKRELITRLKKVKNIKNEQNDIDEYGELIQTVKFNEISIELREKGIYHVKYRKYDKCRDLILDGNFDILCKTTDNRNIDLFTFKFRNKMYHTYSIDETLHKLSDKIYKGNIGKDIIKRVFNFIGDQFKLNDLTYKPEYILGFNNGWKLPQTEIEKRFLIVCYTDLQVKTYNHAKNMLDKYSDKEKEEIKTKLKEFVEITQGDKTKNAILIGWSIAAPFRLAFLDYGDLFPHLYNYGERYTGKGSLEKFWIVRFYDIYDNYLSSITLESTSRLEDHLSESTFPHNIPECNRVQNINTLPILKDHATGISDFERKKNARELDFYKPKVAGLCFDSNKIVSQFKNSAFNSKCITQEYTKDDVVHLDLNWKELSRELKQKKLFSLIYDETKDWDNNKISDTMKSIRETIKTELEAKGINIDTIEANNARLIPIYQIIRFGIKLFEDTFEIELENKDKILDSLIAGRKIISSELHDQFYQLCRNALDFKHLGPNPKYLTCILEETKHATHYAFTQKNLRDFKEFTGKRYKLPELTNLLKDAIDDKDDIEYSNCYPFSTKKRERVILIQKSWLDGA